MYNLMGTKLLVRINMQSTVVPPPTSPEVEKSSMSSPRYVNMDALIVLPKS
jgi:hypothetical protein